MYAEDAQGGQLSESMTAEDAGKQIADNQRAMQAETVEFVQSYRCKHVFTQSYGCGLDQNPAHISSQVLQEVFPCTVYCSILPSS